MDKSTKDERPVDFYERAIPLDEILEIANRSVIECGVAREEDVELCAERVVRERICRCATEVTSVVEAVVEEFKRRVTSA